MAVGTETAAGILFFREIPVASAAAVTGSGAVGFGEGIDVGTGEVEGGGGVDDAEADSTFLGEVGGGFSILLLAPLEIKIRFSFRRFSRSYHEAVAGKADTTGAGAGGLR